MEDSDNKGWTKDGRAWFGFVALLLLVILILVAKWQWNWLSPEDPKTGSNGETLRNVGLLIGGVLALVFALWRGWVAERQANSSQSLVKASQKQVEAAQHQVETAQQGLLNDRYQRSAEMLGSTVMAVRLAGLYALRRLAEEHPAVFHAQCMELLCAFVRTPTRDTNVSLPGPEDWHIVGSKIREDVQAAISFIGQRDLGRVTVDLSERIKIDLRGANLAGADLREHCLDGADLTDAVLAYARLERAFFVDTQMTGADLTGARMEGAYFSDSNCKWAKFSSARARSANFSRACLEGAVMTGARLQSATLTHAKLIGSDLRGAKLTGTNVSGAVLGQGKILVDDPPYELISDGYTRITQEQLDAAVAEAADPPKIDPVTKDASTGLAVSWRGQSIQSSSNSC